jgi:hypothetical protein
MLGNWKRVIGRHMLGVIKISMESPAFGYLDNARFGFIGAICC